MVTDKKNEPSSDVIYTAYLFTGEVDSRRAAAVDRIVSQVVDAGSETFDLEKFDGNAASVENILAAINMVPFGSDRKVVVVDRVDRLNPNDQERIAAFIPKLGQQSCLILLASEDGTSKSKPSQAAKEKTADEEGPESQKRSKGLQPKLAAAVKAHGKVVSLPKLKSQDLAALAAQIVKAHSKKIEPLALQALTYSVAAHPATIEREVEKLEAYTGDRDTITLNDVERVVPRSPEDRVFPLIDAVAAGQSETAVHLLNETFMASPKPDNEVMRMVSLLAKHFRLLYQVKYLMTEHKVRYLDSLPDELQSMLMREHNPISVLPWQKPKLINQANMFTLDDLRRCLKQTLLCELAVKGLGRSNASPRLNLEMLVLKLSRRKSLPLQ